MRKVVCITVGCKTRHMHICHTMLNKTGEKKLVVKSRYFRVSNEGIQLVKSGMPSSVIGYDSIGKVVVKWGIEVENWFLVLVMGILIFCLGCYLSSGILMWVISGGYAGSYKGVFTLLIPFCGLYFVYSALKAGPVMVVLYGEGKSVRLPVKEVMDRMEFDKMIEMLPGALGNRLQVLLNK